MRSLQKFTKSDRKSLIMDRAMPDLSGFSAGLTSGHGRDYIVVVPSRLLFNGGQKKWPAYSRFYTERSAISSSLLRFSMRSDL